MKVTNVGPFDLQRTVASDVAGTGFPANPLTPIKIDKKKKKKKEKGKIGEFFGIELTDEVIKTLRVEKRGDRWCVVHGHPKKPDSKTDKPAGTVIKCFPKKEEADSMHKAIIISQIKRGKLTEDYLTQDTELKQIVENLDDFTLINDFVFAVGSTVEKGKGKDFDVLIRMSEDFNDYLRRAISIRIQKMIDNSGMDKYVHEFSEAEGPHDKCISLYRLKLERIYPSKIMTMQEIETEPAQIELMKPYSPQKPYGSAYYEIDKFIEALK